MLECKTSINAPRPSVPPVNCGSLLTFIPGLNYLKMVDSYCLMRAWVLRTLDSGFSQGRRIGCFIKLWSLVAVLSMTQWVGKQWYLTRTTVIRFLLVRTVFPLEATKWAARIKMDHKILWNSELMIKTDRERWREVWVLVTSCAKMKSIWPFAKLRPPWLRLPTLSLRWASPIFMPTIIICHIFALFFWCYRSTGFPTRLIPDKVPAKSFKHQRKISVVIVFEWDWEVFGHTFLHLQMSFMSQFYWKFPTDSWDVLWSLFAVKLATVSRGRSLGKGQSTWNLHLYYFESIRYIGEPECNWGVTRPLAHDTRHMIEFTRTRRDFYTNPQW